MRPLLHRWRRSAAEIAALLLLVQLPVASLYKLSSWLLVMQLGEIAEEVALLIVIYALAALACGLVIAAIESALARVSERLARHWHALGIVFFVAAVTLTMLAPAMAWWKGFVTHIPGLRRIPLPLSFLALMLLAIVAVIAQARKVGWLEGVDRFSARLTGATRAIQIVVGLSALLVIVTGHVKWQPFGWHRAEPAAQAKANAPNVILISIDTLAAKDMSLYGYRLPTTPHLDEFARSAYVFEHYYANSNYTVPTVTSMQTGRYPTSHRVTQLRGRLVAGDGQRTLARVLQQNGYVTAAVVANDGAHPMYLGFSEGYDFQAAPMTGAPGHSVAPALTLVRSRAYHWLWDWWCGPYTYVLYPMLNFGELQKRNWYPAERVIDQAVQVAQGDNKPLFLWTHFMSPHEPYLPPAPFLGKFLPAGELDSYRRQLQAARGAMGPYRRADQPIVDKLRLRYDEFISYTDDAVSQLLERLQHAGVLDHAIVIITADHGQSFERGWHGHVGPYLHDALIRIPLVVKLPGQTQGARLTANAEEVDLLPTILDLIGVQPPQWVEGLTLRPALERDEDSGRPKLSVDMEHEGRFGPPRTGNYALIEGRQKFIHRQASGCEELYDLAADPDELSNRIDEMSAERRAALRDVLARRVGVALQAKPAAGDCKHMDAEFAAPREPASD